MPLLTHREELELGRLVQSWQQWPGGPLEAPALVQRRGMRARERMVTANLRMVVAQGRKYWPRARLAGYEMSDLLQEGVLGLQRVLSQDAPLGEDGSTLRDLVASDATDQLDGMEAAELLARMRVQEPDALALIELEQDHRAQQLAPMLGCSFATVPSRLAAARARLRAVG